MLSNSFKTIKTILDGICVNTLLVDDETEKDFLLQIIFTKTTKHRVVFVPFDDNWCILPEFECVAKALIKLSSIILLLNTYEDKFKKKKSRDVIQAVRSLFHLIREGLRELGCIHPPFKTGTYLKRDDVISGSLNVLEYFTKNTID